MTPDAAVPGRAAGRDWPPPGEAERLKRTAPFGRLAALALYVALIPVALGGLGAGRTVWFALTLALALGMGMSHSGVARRLRRGWLRWRCRLASAPEAPDWPYARDGRAGISLWRRRVPIGILRWLLLPAAVVVVGVFVLPPGFRLYVALLPAVFSVCVGAWLVARGSVHVRWDGFPLRTGAPARFSIATTAGSPRLERAAVLLRCVDVGTVAGGEHTRWGFAVELPPEHPPGPDEFVPVTIDVPAGLPSTCLLGAPGVRWELVVDGTTRWGRLTETFVVPVYGASA